MSAPLAFLSGMGIAFAGAFWITTFPASHTNAVATRDYVQAVAVVVMGLVIAIAAGVTMDCQRRHEESRR